MPTVTNDQLFDPELRLDPRGRSANFFTTILAGKWRVLDAAAGNGCDSAMLFRHGHSVVCNEIDGEQLSEAKHVADTVGAELEFTQLRWETIGELLPPNSQFDAVLVTRNALGMAERTETNAALKQFLALLNDGGVLVVDERGDVAGAAGDIYAPSVFGEGELITQLNELGEVTVYADYELTPVSPTTSATLRTYVVQK